MKVEGGKPPGSSLPICTSSMICCPAERGRVDKMAMHASVGLAANLGNDGEKAKLWYW